MSLLYFFNTVCISAGNEFQKVAPFSSHYTPNCRHFLKCKFYFDATKVDIFPAFYPFWLTLICKASLKFSFVLKVNNSQYIVRCLFIDVYGTFVEHTISSIETSLPLSALVLMSHDFSSILTTKLQQKHTILKETTINQKYIKQKQWRKT